MAKINVRNRKKADGSNNWEYRFEGAKVDGKRKHISKSGFKTKKEALEEGTKALAKFNRAGSHFEPSEISVSDFLDYWFNNYVKVNCKYNTQLDYDRIITNHLKPTFANYRLNSLTPSICQEWVNKIYVNSGLSAKTLKNITIMFASALAYAVEPAKFIESSPMTYVKFPKNTSKKKETNRTIITIEDFDRMCERLKSTPYYYALMIGFYTGMRIGEVYGLTWDDIDFEEGTITVNKQIIKRNFEVDTKTRIHGKQERSSWYFETTKTPSSNRTIKIGETLLNTLREYQQKQIENEEVYGEYYTLYYLKDEKDEKGQIIQRIIPVQKLIPCSLPTSNLVFRKESGEYSSTDSFKYAARVIHHELGIQFNFHSLRHTHATKLVEAGVPIKAIQTRLGHADITTTLQTYTHTTEAMEQGVVDTFEDIMSTI